MVKIVHVGSLPSSAVAGWSAKYNDIRGYSSFEQSHPVPAKLVNVAAKIASGLPNHNLWGSEFTQLYEHMLLCLSISVRLADSILSWEECLITLLQKRFIISPVVWGLYVG